MLLKNAAPRHRFLTGMASFFRKKSSVTGSPSAQRARADPHLQRLAIGGFELESGETLPPDAELAYKVYNGPDDVTNKGLILHPTSFDAVHTDLEYQIGPGKTLDTNQYTVIIPNMLGNGVSFSPSTAKTKTIPFPHITIGDNVRLQRKLLLQKWGEKPLKLVYGYSMGGLQAYEWALRYPDDVEGIAVVCGASHCSEINEVFLLSLEAALQADPMYCVQQQRFLGHPEKGLRAFATIYAGWGVGLEYYSTQSYRESGYQSANDFVTRSYLPAFVSADANDLLAQLQTWKTANTSLRDVNNLQRLETIQAHALLMPCDTDRYFRVEASQREAQVLRSSTLQPIRSNSGHRAGDPHRPELTAELHHIHTNVHELLALLEERTK